MLRLFLQCEPEAMLLFIDESGHDCKVIPWEVVAGVAISERNLTFLTTPGIEPTNNLA